MRKPSPWTKLEDYVKPEAPAVEPRVKPTPDQLVGSMGLLLDRLLPAMVYLVEGEALSPEVIYGLTEAAAAAAALRDAYLGRPVAEGPSSEDMDLIARITVRILDLKIPKSMVSERRKYLLSLGVAIRHLHEVKPLRLKDWLEAPLGTFIRAVDELLDIMDDDMKVKPGVTPMFAK